MNDARLTALAQRARRGDGEAFATLCRLLQGDVWRYGLAVTGDPELAAEAGQDTFLRAVTAIRRFRGDGPVRVWLLVLARRAAADVLLRECRAAPVAEVGRVEAVPADTGVVEVHQLIADLPVDLRQAFALTQVVGLTYAEAAAVAGCRLATIRSRVYRARARLVAALDGGAEVDDARS